METGSFIRPTPEEIAFGVLGRLPATPAAGPAPRGARAALEHVIDEFLGNGPVFVGFSGGRDSSAVLAVATARTRQRGLPDPIPVIRRYPGDPDSDETEWQELVLDHLGIREPVIIDVVRRAGYLDDTAKEHLRQRGLVWPPALQLDDPALPISAGGTFLTGEGGDEVLGTRRVTPLTLLLDLHRRPSRALLYWALDALIPRALYPAGNAIKGELQWLTAAARAEYIARSRRDDRRPLHWGRETEQMLDRLLPAVLAHNYQVIARDYGIRLGHPLLDPRFLRALAAEGGRWGFAGRTAAMRHLFSDLLPDGLLSRSSKAHFGAVRWGEPEREFARRWDGCGLPELIDPEGIRAEWLSERPSGASALALHAAWLHSAGLHQSGPSVPLATAVTPELGNS